MILEANFNVCVKVKGNLCNGCNFETEDGDCILFNCALGYEERKNSVYNKRCNKCLDVFKVTKINEADR